MKASRYNIIVKGAGPGEALLYNTLHGSLTLLTTEEASIAKQILLNPNQDSQPHAQITHLLVSQRHLVDDAEDELKTILQRRRAGMDDQNRLDVIMLPTLDCNFGCKYCYEERRRSSMSPLTERSIRAWLTAEIPRHKVTILHWFGGEPLIEYNKILSISRTAREAAGRSDSLAVISITTNGFLLTRRRARELVDEDILTYQITVDGNAESHNRLRPLRNGKNSFDRVLNNIVVLARTSRDIRISLRVNFNHTNLKGIPELLELIPVDVRSQLRVVYEPIFGGDDLSATANLLPREISQAMGQLYETAGICGYEVREGFSGAVPGKLTYCYAERDSQYVIDFNANVFKCTVGRFSADERVGYIDSSGQLIRIEESWCKWVDRGDLDPICCECSYLPLCMGGCPKVRRSHHGDDEGCSLVAANSSYLLKRLALGGMTDVIRDYAEPNDRVSFVFKENDDASVKKAGVRV